MATYTVNPDTGQLDIVGTGGGGGGGGTTDFVTNSGTAVESGGQINVLGTAAQGVTTSATGLTVTITNANASTSQKGVLETSTDAEVVAASSTVVAMTPSNMVASYASPQPIGSTTPSSGAFTTFELTADQVQVSEGGTGTNTLLDGGILIGNGTSAIQSVGPMTDGTVLIGRTGLDPSVALLTAGSGISITPASGSITIAQGATVPTTFNADSGSAQASLNILNVVGGTGASTSASGSTVTITASAAVPTSFATDSGTAIPAANVVTVAGGTGLNSSGASSTVTLNLDVPVTVANGGTGATSYTDGQLLIGATAGNTLGKATLTAGEGIDITNGTSTITIDCELATAAATVGASNLGVTSFLNDDFGVSSGFTSLNDAVVKSVGSDSGTATPTGHSFSIAGTGGVTTSATGTTVTVDGSGVVASSSLTQLILFDDFLHYDYLTTTTTGYFNWRYVTGGSTAEQASTAGHPGIVAVDDEFYSSAFILIGSGEITLETWIRVYEGSEIDSLWGLSSLIYLNSATNAIFFSADSGNSAYWQTKTVKAAVTTTTTTSVLIVDGSWVHLKMVIASDGGSVEFFIDDVSVGTHSTNIPLTTTALRIIWDHGGNGSPAIDLDAVNLIWTLTGDRA